jgi:hypothetical protein
LEEKTIKEKNLSREKKQKEENLFLKTGYQLNNKILQDEID